MGIAIETFLCGIHYDLWPKSTLSHSDTLTHYVRGYKKAINRDIGIDCNNVVCSRAIDLSGETQMFMAHAKWGSGKITMHEGWRWC